MKGLITVCSFLFLFIGENKGESCDNLGTLFYEELLCKPVKDEGGACPKEYNCPDYAVSDKYCNFQGKEIKVDEPLGRSAGCNVGCFCSKHGDAVAKFTCAIVDCVEFFGPPLPSNCYRTHSLDSCCSIGQNCPADDVKVPQCVVDGQTYNETQMFRPKNTCLNCLCTIDFKEGKYADSSDCQPRVCASEIGNSEEIAKKCAAVYYKNSDDDALCCPQTWICADEAEDVITPSGDTGHSDLKCKYGDKTLNYKDSFTRKVSQYGKNRDIRCSCELPPLVTCIGDS